MSNRRFTLVRRPQGLPCSQDFALVQDRMPDVGPGEILIRNEYASIDPAMRGWLSDEPSYIAPVALGQAVRCNTLARIIRSRRTGFEEGAWVVGLHALEDYSLVKSDAPLRVVDIAAVPSPTHHLSILGGAGLTAYFGLIEVGRVRAGETVLVSGAAGAVGSLAGQIAGILGCRTIGIGGGPDKLRRLMDDYRYDHAIDYKGKTEQELVAEIASVAPSGVDMLFENVGGTILEAGLLSMRQKGRVALCGLISQYNARDGAPGIRNLWQLIVKRASLTGFLVGDYAGRFAEARDRIGDWLGNGQLRVDEHVEVGLENSLTAFLRLFDGSNEGKMLLKLREN